MGDDDLLDNLLKHARPLTDETPFRSRERSMIAIIANPDAFHEVEVVVTGFFRFMHEDQAIYISREHAEHGLYANGLWVSVSDELAREALRLNNRYVQVKAVFNARRFGHMGLWAGTLERISRLYAHE